MRNLLRAAVLCCSNRLWVFSRDQHCQYSSSATNVSRNRYECFRHGRMLPRQSLKTRADVVELPVILDPDSYDLWLDKEMKDVAAASDLLKPCDARLMRSYPVSNRVNSALNDDEECSRPVELAETQNRLFS